MNKTINKFSLLAITLTLASTVSYASPVVRGKASYHNGYSGMTTAARGVRMGPTLKVTNPKTGKSIRVVVKDANGGKMKGWGRVLDLSPQAFKRLYGSTKKGTGPVSYRVVKKGKGRLIPR